MFKDTSIAELDQIMESSWNAYNTFRSLNIQTRARFLRVIADHLENSGDGLIHVAQKETNLPEARLKNERGRTVFQLRSYADACEKGLCVDVRIDHANTDRTPPKPDLRKMNIGVGPVVVFGASNFPFAYSTAGGDTASAFAAGCSVVVKAHPAHPGTSDMVAEIILKAVKETGMPSGVFQHVHGISFEVGKHLVMHDCTKAVGFTGSFIGGKQLYDWAQMRKEPIPVFSEMGSVNPVFLFKEKIVSQAEQIADMLAGSITLGVGQFCTNPGLMIACDGEELNHFKNIITAKINNAAAAKMLHPGISKAYVEKKSKALEQANVEVLAEGIGLENGEGQATIATTTGRNFLNNPHLHKEVFGPYSLLVICRDINELNEVAASLEGQLTASVFMSENECNIHQSTINILELKCGRLILNGVPTGVEVAWGMQHGGPFPATTDVRFGAVGPDAVKRFSRPISYQQFSDIMLPDELKESNPLHIPRLVDDTLIAG